MLQKRNIYILLIALFAVWIVTGDESSPCRATPDARKLHVSLYYESLCPYSIAIITEKIVPMYEQIKNHVELLFVPFGFSEREGNSTEFTCHHGVEECRANRIQSCVLDVLDNDQDEFVRFLACQMNKTADATGKECAELVNVAYETLLECQNGPKGFELELKAENQTRTIVGEGQRLRFVPYVVYDRKLNRYQQERSSEELEVVICESLDKIYCKDVMPPICANYTERYAEVILKKMREAEAAAKAKSE